MLAGACAGTYTMVNAYVADVTPFGTGFVAGPALGGLLGSGFLLAAAALGGTAGMRVIPPSSRVYSTRATQPDARGPNQEAVSAGGTEAARGANQEDE
ncbi:MAG TPA: hypothetical protein VJT31_04005 [Rugosimonospora sp.]|nr:hypothetical protein [Rugosimonospora sp.]